MLAETEKRPALACNICGNTAQNAFYAAREMMFGMRDPFTYLECAQCQCLQLTTPPANLSKYYPPNYYSFATSPLAKYENRVKNIVRGIRVTHAVTGGFGPLGSVLYRRHPEAIPHTLRPTGVTKRSRILDVGCGSGTLVYGLYFAGFKHVVGIDPFLDATVFAPHGPPILKQSIYDMGGEWDLIMMHHVFEHLADPLETLQATHQRLAPRGMCLIRIPICSSYAWQHYRTAWAQLDAPRHFFLHSIRSMQLLAQRTGFALERIVYDSTEFQFWASEQYTQNVGLDEPASYKYHPERVPDDLMARYRAQAEDLNRQQQGDQAAFYLRKI